MKRCSVLFLLVNLHLLVSAQLVVSADHQHFSKDGKPFLWLGDTGWELFHRLNREEAKQYLLNRARKGFNVIQAVAFAEFDGVNGTNAYGDKPLFDNDPTKPNEAYFRHVDFIIEEANRLGLTIALLPTWGDKWNKKWGEGPEIFTPENARQYAAWIAHRYRNNQVIWILGGDRNPETDRHYKIIRAMAAGIRDAVQHKQLITYHTAGAKSSFDFFPDEDWLDFHMTQTGHFAGSPDYKINVHARTLTRQKPMVNGEPNYEDHPNDFKPVEKGWLDAFDTREAAYWNMLSGGAGHTYGNHNIWQMYDEKKRKPINNARTNWHEAMDAPGAYQVGYMKQAFESRDWQQLVPDQSLIVGDNPEGLEFKVAAVSAAGDFMMVYIPFGSKTTVDLRRLKSAKLKAWWFNPRDGHSIPIPTFDNMGQQEFVAGSVGRGSDWLLLIDDAAKNYPDPAVQKRD